MKNKVKCLDANKLSGQLEILWNDASQDGIVGLLKYGKILGDSSDAITRTHQTICAHALNEIIKLKDALK